jgi:hypothetical protein
MPWKPDTKRRLKRGLLRVEIFHDPTDDELEELDLTRAQYIEKFIRAIELAHGLDRERLN